ncbi:MAG: hypothetical protein QF657_05155, partial [Candidatus Nitrosopelagicus sp.]|nr:hypothetical protein [Candidatus Nitrosopelagicus sp.]
MSTLNTNEAFVSANRTLRVKRRRFNTAIIDFLQSLKSESPPELTEVREKYAHFKTLWDEVVTSTTDCVNLINEGEDEDGDEAEKLSAALEVSRYKMEHLDVLAGEYERKALVVSEGKPAVFNEGDDIVADKTEPSVPSTSEASGETIVNYINSNPNITTSNKNVTTKDVDSENALESKVTEGDDDVMDDSLNVTRGTLTGDDSESELSSASDNGKDSG